MTAALPVVYRRVVPRLPTPRLLAIELSDIVQAVVSTFVLLRNSVFVSGSSTHGDVEFDECLVVGRRGVNNCAVVRGAQAGRRRRRMRMGTGLRSRL